MRSTSTSAGLRGWALLLGVLVAIGPVLAQTRPARAAITFTVNLPGDAADVDTADNVCDASRGGGRQCTLRAAIEQANDTPGHDTINFAIPGLGVKTIRPATGLPFVTDPVTIDGYTQPGAKPNTATVGTNAQLRIELDGSLSRTNRPVADGLRITLGAAGSIVRGLVINNFALGGVRVQGSQNAPVTGVTVAGNFIGTNPAGTVARGNFLGVRAYFAKNLVVGGSALADRNLISSNEGAGVLFTTPNLTDTAVQGNLIGTAADGRSVLGNGRDGVNLGDTRNVTVGGASVGAANTIAYNGGAGVAVGGAGARILRNAIFANAGLGIDLGANGPNPNDPGDGDSGANGRQNTPLIASATTSGGATTVRGTLNSTPNRLFLIQVFSDPAGDEGKVFRGETRVQTNASGNANFAVRSARAIPAGDNVTATATGDEGTSEFSPPATAT